MEAKNEKQVAANQDAEYLRRQLDKAAPTPMLVDPVRAQLLHMFDLLDQRGRDCVMSCAANNLRYPKEQKL